MAQSIHEKESFIIRFSGDSGDGMQMTGDQFSMASAMNGDAISTLPDYPSEIRAPLGTVAGVSGFQLRFGSAVYSCCDYYDALVVMNPAALKVDLPWVKKGGVILVNEDAFNEKGFEKAGYASNPLEDGSLSGYQVHRVHMVKIAEEAAASSGLIPRQLERCKNFVALGLSYSLFGRPIEPTLNWLKRKFASKAQYLQANEAALRAGFEYGEKSGSFPVKYKVKKTGEPVKPGAYRYITGNVAAAMGIITAARKAGVSAFLGSYPITPATEILQTLSTHRQFIKAFQAEDEIAGIGSAVGAAFSGALAATSTSGPGLSLKAEFLGLAVILELPLVLVNVQRGGPSTGLPTKTEQSDLMQAIWGRHGESPVVVLSALSPKDCFEATFEASRIALKYMTPVIVLSEGMLGQGAESWRVPELSELPEIKVEQRKNPEGFQPYSRDLDTLARPWAVPGTPGLEHRIGSLEKAHLTGTNSHDPLNHEKMTMLRAEKVARVAREIPPTEIYGDPSAGLLLVGWGGTYGVLRQAVDQLRAENVSVACVNLRYLNPLPTDLPTVLKKFPRRMVVENNLGQLWRLLRSEYLIDSKLYNKVQGRPFLVSEVVAKVREELGAKQ